MKIEVRRRNLQGIGALFNPLVCMRLLIGTTSCMRVVMWVHFVAVTLTRSVGGHGSFVAAVRRGEDRVYLYLHARFVLIIMPSVDTSHLDYIRCVTSTQYIGRFRRGCVQTPDTINLELLYCTCIYRSVSCL